jgi:hypothetical protein
MAMLRRRRIMVSCLLIHLIGDELVDGIEEDRSLLP